MKGVDDEGRMKDEGRKDDEKGRRGVERREQ